MATPFAFDKQKVEYTDSEPEEAEANDADKSTKEGSSNDETEAQDNIKSLLKEREEQIGKQINKIYDSSYLRRLMRLISIFTSVGGTQAYAKQMV